MSTTHTADIMAIAPEPPRSLKDWPKPAILLSGERAKVLVLEACNGASPAVICVVRDCSREPEDLWAEDLTALQAALKEAFPSAEHMHLKFFGAPSGILLDRQYEASEWQPGPGTILVSAGTILNRMTDLSNPEVPEDGSAPLLDALDQLAAPVGAHVLLLSADGMHRELRPGIMVRPWSDPAVRAPIPELVSLPRFPAYTMQDLRRLEDAADQDEPGADAAFTEMATHMAFHSLERRNPSLARLLTVCALPVQISSRYLRAARMTFVPWALPSLERDLRVEKDFISVRLSRLSEMPDVVCTALRRRLAADPDLLDEAYRTLTACHADSPSMAWENEVTWLVLSDIRRIADRNERLDMAFQSAEKTLDDPERAERVAHWLQQAIDHRLAPLLGTYAPLNRLRERVSDVLETPAAPFHQKN